MSLRDLDVDIALDIDKDPLAELNREIDEFIMHVESIDDSPINDLTREFRGLTRTMDSSTDEAKVLNRQLKEMDKNISIDINLEEALAEMKRLKVQIEALDRENVNVDLDVRQATSQLSKLYLQIKAIDAQDIDIDVDIKGALSELAVLRTQLNAFKATEMIKAPQGVDILSNLNIGGLVKLMGLLILIPTVLPFITALTGVIGTLGVVIGVLAGGLLAFASAAAVAGGGLLGFGAIAISSITDLYEENAKLTKEQKALKRETDKVVDSWNQLKSSLSDEIFDVVASGAKSLNTILNMSEPILQKVGSSLSNLMDSFNQSLKSNDVKGFFDFLDRSAGPLISDLGRGFGEILRGVGNIAVAFEPLTLWMGYGFKNMMTEFADWTSGLKDSNGMTKFIDYVKENLPKIGSIIGDTTLGITDLFAAFGGTASDGLDWFAGKMEDFSKWASGLGENKEFQNFLKDIKTEAPIVVDALKEIGKFLGNIFDLFDDKGQMLESVTNLFEGINDFMDSDFGTKLLNSIFMPHKNADVKNGEVPQSTMGVVWTDFIVPLVWDSFITGLVWESFIKGLVWESFIKGLVWNNFIKGLVWNSFIKGLVWNSFIKGLVWNTFIKSLVWNTFIKSLVWGNFIKVLSWAKYLNPLRWGSFVKGISWSSFIPKLSWGSFVGSIKSLVNGSHATGLGRVPFNGYMAELHNNEAVLTADQANALRSAGMLQGDGTAPTLDMGAVASYQPLSDGGTSTTTVSNGGSTSVTNHFEINVQGSDNPKQTAVSVREELENFFADLSDIFPAVMEG